MAETGEKTDPLRIMLWGVPRSASTVFLKFMSFVDYTEVWHEPYMLSFVNEIRGKGEHEFNEESMSMMKPLYDMFPEGKRGNLLLMETFSYEWVKKSLEKGPKDPSTKFIFVKDMAFSIHNRVEFLPKKVPTKHVFLIRHPHRFLPSHHAHMKRLLRKSSYDESDEVLMRTGEDEILKLWKYVRENVDPNPPVIDADQYLQAPEKVLSKLFAEMGIPWKDSYLSWDDSDDIIMTWNGGLEHNFGDKMFQGQAFTRAFQSGKFHAVDQPIPKKEDLDPYVISLVDKYMPGYEEMSKHVL